MVAGAGCVHGYESRENARLQDQAGTPVDLLHADTQYPTGSLVLEAGCGVGAQTVTLARRSPGARFVSVDISPESIAEARRRTDAAGLTNVELRQADIFALPFERGSFDHVFVRFVLEHFSRPVDALQLLKELVKPGGTVTVIEGDHGWTYFHPESRAARRAIECPVELQRVAGGDALIGRQLYPLMLDAGLEAVTPELAAAEGEGDGSLEHWRDARWEALSRELSRTGRQPARDMPVVCERFAVVFPESE